MSWMRQWLGDDELERFRTAQRLARPRSGAHGACAAASACDWRMLDEVLARAEVDTLVVQDAALRDDVVPPRSLSELRGLLARGIGVAARNASQSCASIVDLCRALADVVPGDQRTIVFATPKNTRGFGWHFDAEEVFILQTTGDKSYYFRENTVSARPLRPGPEAFAAFREEASPLMTCRLIAGDVLYLPSGFWHSTYAHEDSLSVSLGVLSEPPDIV
jgi:hypothetical protein